MAKPEQATSFAAGMRWKEGFSQFDVSDPRLQLPFKLSSLSVVKDPVYVDENLTVAVRMSDWRYSRVRAAQREFSRLQNVYDIDVVHFLPIVIGRYLDDTYVTMLVSRYVSGMNVIFDRKELAARNAHPDIVEYCDEVLASTIRYCLDRFLKNQPVLTDICKLHQFVLTLNEEGKIDGNSRCVLIDIDPYIGPINFESVSTLLSYVRRSIFSAEQHFEEALGSTVSFSKSRKQKQAFDQAFADEYKFTLRDLLGTSM